MNFAKIILLSAPFLTLLAANAEEESKTVRGWAVASCETPLQAVIEMAHNKAIEQLGDSSKYQRVSPWLDDARYVEWPYDLDGACWHATANTQATFMRIGS